MPKDSKHVLPPKPVLELEKTNMKPHHLLHAFCLKAIRTHSIERASTNHSTEGSEEPINLPSPSDSILPPAFSSRIQGVVACLCFTQVWERRRSPSTKRPSCSGLFKVLYALAPSVWYTLPTARTGSSESSSKADGKWGLRRPDLLL